MSLPPSGPLSFNDIASELGIGTTPLSLRSMSALAGFSTPDAVSEFYGYPPVTTVTLYININIDNYSTYGYQGDNNSWQILDVTAGSTEVFYLEYWDEYEGTYSTSITLTVGHNYYFNGYMATNDAIFNEFVWQPQDGFSGYPIYTLNENCVYWQNGGFSSGYGNFTINSGGDMYMYGNVTIFDSGTDIDQCDYS